MTTSSPKAHRLCVGRGVGEPVAQLVAADALVELASHLAIDVDHLVLAEIDLDARSHVAVLPIDEGVVQAGGAGVPVVVLDRQVGGVRPGERPGYGLLALVLGFHGLVEHAGQASSTYRDPAAAIDGTAIP
jgi:hypothetical protein